MVKGITRRAFLKLASLCGAAVAGLVGLPKATKQMDNGNDDGQFSDPFVRLGYVAVRQWNEGFGEWHVVPPPSPLQLHQCETESARYVIFRNDDGSFLYSEDGGFFFQGPMNFWDMPEDVRKAWRLDQILGGQSKHKVYIMQNRCGKPTAW